MNISLLRIIILQVRLTFILLI